MPWWPLVSPRSPAGCWATTAATTTSATRRVLGRRHSSVVRRRRNRGVGDQRFALLSDAESSNPSSSAAAAFLGLLDQRGIAVAGGSGDGAAPAGVGVLAGVQSAPLSEYRQRTAGHQRQPDRRDDGEGDRSRRGAARSAARRPAGDARPSRVVGRPHRRCAAHRWLRPQLRQSAHLRSVGRGAAARQCYRRRRCRAGRAGATGLDAGRLVRAAGFGRRVAGQDGHAAQPLRGGSHSAATTSWPAARWGSSSSSTALRRLAMHRRGSNLAWRCWLRARTRRGACSTVVRKLTLCSVVRASPCRTTAPTSPALPSRLVCAP